jgi:putative membrane protein
MNFRSLIATLCAAVLIAAPASSAAARPISPDADFLVAAHQADLTQIAAGRIAARKGTAPAVRDLGRQFVSYHRKLDAQVREAARGLAVELPKQPNTDQQTLLALYRAAGTEFDTLYLDSQLLAHERALKAARLVLDTGTDPGVKLIVTAAVPVVQQHHEALIAAQTKIGNKQRRQ